MRQPQPLHVDRHGAVFNFTLMLSLAVAVMGYFSEPLLVVIGVAMAAFSWLTTPSQYIIFDDHMVIAYGKPRVRNIPFRQVRQIEMVKLPFGNRLLVQLRSGRRFLIQPRNAEGFESKFRGALDSYLREHQEGQQDTGPSQPPAAG